MPRLNFLATVPVPAERVLVCEAYWVVVPYWKA